jgi:hypothetical protein
VTRILAIIAVLLVVSCGVRPSGVIRGGQAPTGTVAGAQVYLVRNARVTSVTRLGSLPAEALALLAAGPTRDEEANGITTELPSGLTLTALDGTVTVSADVSQLSELAVEQIVCTASVTGGFSPVTLVGGGQTRGPAKCPA